MVDGCTILVYRLGRVGLTRFWSIRRRLRLTTSGHHLERRRLGPDPQNGTVYSFLDSSSFAPGPRSAIGRIKDRYGNTITMTRHATTALLRRITSPNGRWIN